MAIVIKSLDEIYPDQQRGVFILLGANQNGLLACDTNGRIIGLDNSNMIYFSIIEVDGKKPAEIISPYIDNDEV